jgi:hypothetical protein
VPDHALPPVTGNGEHATVKLRRRVGRRGTFLVLFGLYDIFYGWYLAAGGTLLAVPLFSERTWGIIWITTGIVLICGSLLKQDKWLFALATLIKVAWAMEFFRLQMTGVPLEWTRGMYFLVLALIVVTASAVPS